MADVITPMMQQYQRLRGSVPADVLLLFRLGDFYELFFEDAKEAAGLLNGRADETERRADVRGAVSRGAKLYREIDQGR